MNNRLSNLPKRVIEGYQNVLCMIFLNDMLMILLHIVENHNFLVYVCSVYY